MVNPGTVSAHSQTRPLRAIAAVCGAHKSRSLTQTDRAKKSHVHQSNTLAIDGGPHLDVGTLEKLSAGERYGLYAAPTQKPDIPIIAAVTRSSLASAESSDSPNHNAQAAGSGT